MRRAAEQARGLAEAERAWRSVAMRWSTSTAVVSLSDGVLTVAVTDRAVAEEVRRRSAGLVSELCARMSRVRSIRVTVAGAGDDGGARRRADAWR
ncbi:MAG: DciA family protein [Phycisphaerae bacterium]|nr:DUF721 domain-containing protein [Phycisphaerae bacterium]MCZ2400810.1 DciA family protein [Phycisphaerae bacterium]NUQ48398.1 DUF721 domain-containing protein [Phycisphaerae bacterium]